jgi:hypothetical protein
MIFPLCASCVCFRTPHPLPDPGARPAARGHLRLGQVSAHCLQAQRGPPLLRAAERWQHLWWVERGALRLYYLDREGVESNKNFFLDHAMPWPMTPTLRRVPVMFHVEPMEDSTVWALPIPPDGTPPAAGWPAWSQLEHRTLCALLDGKMQREQDFVQLSARQRYEQLMRQQPQWTAPGYPGMTDTHRAQVRQQWTAAANLWRVALILAAFAAALATLVGRLANHRADDEAPHYTA